MGAGRPPTTVGADGHRTNSSAQLQNGEARGDMPIRVLVTGGTFDKNYDELTGRLFFRETHVPEMLRLGRARVDLVVETVTMMTVWRWTTSAGRKSSSAAAPPKSAAS